MTRQSSSEAFEFSDVSVPAVSRRLQTCSEIEVQVTSWVSSNPYAYAIGGFNDQVLANANVTNVELFRCGLTLSSTVDPLSVVIVSDPGTAPDGESWHALCLLWNSSASSWSDSLVEVSSTNDTSATCQALNGGLAGSYTVIWNSWSVNGTTTTAEEESGLFIFGVAQCVVCMVLLVQDAFRVTLQLCVFDNMASNCRLLDTGRLISICFGRSSARWDVMTRRASREVCCTTNS